MAELSLADHIALCYSKDFSLVRALIATRILAPSDIAAAYREEAEDIENDRIRPLLISLADNMDWLESQMKNGATPRWTPEVVPGGRDEDDAAD